MRRDFEFKKKFKKAISKIKGKQAEILFKKIEEILNCKGLSHYKNLRNDLKNYKKVHVNGSYVILFQDKLGKIYFIDYDHHDKIYMK